MAKYVLIVDLEDTGSPYRYEALNRRMHDLGFAQRGPKTLRLAQYSVTSSLPLGRLKRMVQDRIKGELQLHVIVDAHDKGDGPIAEPSRSSAMSQPIAPPRM